MSNRELSNLSATEPLATEIIMLILMLNWNSSPIPRFLKESLSGAPAGDIILNGSTISSDSADVTLDFKGKGFQFSDGYLIGGGTFIIPEGDLFVLPGTEVEPILGGGATLLNQGTIRMEGEKDFIINGNAIVDNQSLFDVTSDADFTGSQISGGTFHNTGTLRKSGGSDVTSLNLWWNFQNDGGTIDVKSGTLQFSCDGTFSDGNYNADLDAKLEFITHTQVFKGTLSGAPAGDILLNGSNISSDSADVTLDFKGKGFQFSYGSLQVEEHLLFPMALYLSCRVIIMQACMVELPFRIRGQLEWKAKMHSS